MGYREDKDVCILMGSWSDDAATEKLIAILDQLEVTYRSAVCSCHWNDGEKFKKFVLSIKEWIIAVIGGCSLQAPAMVETNNKLNQMAYKIVVGIPLDMAAESAIEDVPRGVAIVTPGLNKQGVDHGIINGAIIIAKLVCFRRDPELIARLQRFMNK